MKGRHRSMAPFQRILGVVVCLTLISATMPEGARPQEDYAPLAAADLDSLVAPIALYPDELVAQVLGAATYPEEITEAHDWLQSNSGLEGQALMEAINPAELGRRGESGLHVPFCLEHDVGQSVVDLGTRRGCGDAAGRYDGRRAADALEGVSSGKFEDHERDQSGAAESGSDRDSASKSSGSVCPDIQPDGNLRSAGGGAGVVFASGPGRNADYFFRCRNCDRIDGQQQLLRVGLGRMGHALGHGQHLLPEQHLYREPVLARTPARILPGLPPTVLSAAASASGLSTADVPGSATTHVSTAFDSAAKAGPSD
jgi:hypothetical protein